MLNRTSVVCLVVGVLAGYVLAGPSAAAQSASSQGLPSAVTPGNTLTLSFESGAMSDRVTQTTCNVGEVQGNWVRCKSSDSFQEEREQRWYDLKHVVQIIKRER